ncbi:hypothetical protein B0H63DRAFT_123895 [Podospora didyma]|uniref:Kelch repeat-containing protein n=1 Tax=Podospora didyma TaxID=330526 RepID=A0AAE0U506_9PEZI|nr:hypothetical protein B0H63DRAFT_123895 [Podospora didyma]
MLWRLLPAVVTAFASLAQGQSKWASNQVNTTLCRWQQFRAAVVKDTIYFDGGSSWWIPGLSDGSLGSVDRDDNPLGRVYTLNFSRPFKSGQNVTALFEILSKGVGGGAANNIAPNYYDGGMLANDAEWFTYGGMLMKTDVLSEPAKDIVLGYYKDQYGPQLTFTPGFLFDNLDNNLTRYLAYGGAASAPSENKAWYFSGMHSPSFGPIYESGIDPAFTAVNVSNTLITLDMTTQQKETWTNETLPPGIPGRGTPELVWVPVGAQGILVALGGVISPSYVTVRRVSDNISQNQAQSPGFMTTINIYDVAGKKWYSQPTTGGSPGQLTRGCAVVARAQDGSSFNIYYYGGYTGVRESDPYSDDVWVLSLPSFIWAKISSGSNQGRSQGRIGHKCFTPYPDQMMVVGGAPAVGTGTSQTCLFEVIRVFNMSSGTWLDGYDPAKYSNYTVPGDIFGKIGGTATGGAKVTSPSPSWATTALAEVFATPYPTTKIKTFYPYASVAADNNTNPNLPPSPSDSSSGGGVPSFLPPVLGVVLGLVLLTMIGVLILLWRRRKLFKAGMSDAGTEDTNGHRIMSWMRGQQTTSENKAPTVTTTDDISSSPADVESVGVPPSQAIPEMMNTEVPRPVIPPVELMDTSTSPRAELQDTPLNYEDIINRHSRLGLGDNSSGAGLGFGAINNPSASYYSGETQQIDHASTVSRSTGLGSSPSPQPPTPQPPTPQPPPVIPAVADYRPDSDLLGNASTVNASTPTSSSSHTATMANPRVLSGISNLSERERSHLRGASDTTISSVTSGGGDRILSPSVAIVETPLESPGGTYSSQRTLLAVSPPTAGIREEGEDYLTSRPFASNGNNAVPASPLRRSVFYESREDMNGAGRAGPSS